MSRTKTAVALAAALAATTITTAVFAADPVISLDGVQIKNRQIQTHQIGQQHKEHLKEALRPACVDLAVFASKRMVGTNRVRITYGVRNISRVNYVSGPHQQAVGFTLGGSTLGTHAFANLRAGQSYSWNREVQVPFEIPHTYSVQMHFAPDLRQDGNPGNDDCNAGNDRRNVIVGHAG